MKPPPSNPPSPVPPEDGQNTVARLSEAGIHPTRFGEASDGESPRRLLGVVVAGGQSSRMGRSKSELPHPSGGTFLTHAIERLQACCDGVVCSIATDAAVDRSYSASIDFIEDIRANQGPAEGVARCLAFAARHDYAACLVTPIDMPDLHAEHLSVLLHAWQTAVDPGILCAVSPSTSRLEPLLAIYPVSYQDAIDRLAESENRSLYRFIQKNNFTTIPMPELALRNVNTPNDLET